MRRGSDEGGQMRRGSDEGGSDEERNTGEKSERTNEKPHTYVHYLHSVTKVS